MVKPIKAFAVIKNGKLNAKEIYADSHVTLDKGEELIRVIISHEKGRISKKNRI